MKVFKKYLLIGSCWAGLITVGTGCQLVAAPEALGVRVTPEFIAMGSIYSTPYVQVQGNIAIGSKAVVTVTGPEVDEILQWKGRLGPVWISFDRVHVTGIPSVFLCFSGAPLDTFLNAEAIEEYQLNEYAVSKSMKCMVRCQCRERHIGIPAHYGFSEARCSGVRPTSEQEAFIRKNYLRLKEAEGTYGVLTGGVELGGAQEGRVPFFVRFPWPRKAPPAKYQVTMYECRDWKVLRSSSVWLNVSSVGFPATVEQMASAYPSLYGVLAVIAAAITGFGIDLACACLFGKNGAIKS